MEFLIAKIIGSFAGSSVALVFAEPELGHVALLKQFLVGFVGGCTLSPFFIDLIKVEHTFDYWVFSATVCSIFTYTALRVIFTKKVVEKIINKRVDQ